MPKNETLLGDGLYASFDGEHIVLRAPRDEGGTAAADHYVFLHSGVYRELRAFVKRHVRWEGA